MVGQGIQLRLVVARAATGVPDEVLRMMADTERLAARRACGGVNRAACGGERGCRDQREYDRCNAADSDERKDTPDEDAHVVMSLLNLWRSNSSRRLAGAGQRCRHGQMLPPPGKCAASGVTEQTPLRNGFLQRHRDARRYESRVKATVRLV